MKVNQPLIRDITPGNIDEFSCCGINNKNHEGRRRKIRWSLDHFSKGWKAKVILNDDGQPLGYIEYLPGEFAWRGLAAPGFLFIQCLWTYYTRYRRQGYGGALIESCLEDAKTQGMKGAAVIARTKPWMADPDIWLKNGFLPVDTCPPDYTLLLHAFQPIRREPRFVTGYQDRLKNLGPGLILIRSDQCPHIAKFADDIVRTAESGYGVKPQVIEIKTHEEAQQAPTPYAVFVLIYNGHILADHPISSTRFKNIMNKLST